MSNQAEAALGGNLGAGRNPRNGSDAANNEQGIADVSSEGLQCAAFRVDVSPKPLMADAREVAKELARLIRGEIDFRDFPWLSPQERRALGALGMAMLKAGKPKLARAAFGVLIDLEPETSVHYLMYGHSAALENDVEDAFDYFGKSIRLAANAIEHEDVAAEAFLARGELLLRLGRTVEARADLADACSRVKDGHRRKAIEAYLAA